MIKHHYDVKAATEYLLDGGLVEMTGLISQAMAMGVHKVQIDPDHAMAMVDLAGQSLAGAGSNVGALREASAWAALAAKNMAALEKAVGAEIPDTYVFGSVPVADLSGSLQLTAGDIRALAAAFHATGDAQAPAAPVLPADVRRLVLAATSQEGKSND